MKAALLLFVLTAQQEPVVGFDIDPLREGISALGMISIAVFLDQEKRHWDHLSACDRERRRLTDEDEARFEALARDGGVCEEIPLPVFDRWVLGQDSQLAAKISDYGVFSLAMAPFMFSAFDVGLSQRPAEMMGEDVLVSLQTLGATLLLVQVVKTAAARPRPLTYNRSFDKNTRMSGDARLSFPSGHSALSFAGASLVSVMLIDRYGWSAGTTAAVVGLYGAAAGVAFMRNLAGKHFVTDVLAGAAIGTALGLAIPIFHLDGGREPTPQSSAAARPLVQIALPF